MPHTDYTLAATASPPIRDQKRVDLPVSAIHNASSNDINAQTTIPLGQITCGPKHSRDETTDTLLKDDNANNLSSSPSTTAHKPFFLHPSMWLWEILSLVLAIIVLATIVAVLAAYDKKPSPVVGGITLNTVVAFAATLFRICLMIPITCCIGQLTWVWLQKGYRPLDDIFRFDMASRGPLGALRLLLELKYSFAVSIASGIVIIGIAIGPLLQQSVVFRSASVPILGVGDKSTECFASAAFTYTGSVGDRLSYSTTDVPFNLKSAIYTGLFSSGMVSLPNPPYSCPTGNCTWDPFPTLGVSTQCYDNRANYYLKCPETEDGSKTSDQMQHCWMAAREPWTKPDSGKILYDLLYESGSGSTGVSPKYSYGYSNSTQFDYGFATDPGNTSTSINAGFAIFDWNLVRNPAIPPRRRRNHFRNTK
ncbi:hypothetical protein GQ44DRAFT_431259 [Phaeosphaeriaceae sp. PMI808]|nr:hypothetical protein GQ44DRAFT_431259 [Phaeosphaeriaceae sp. PMI808]